MEIKLVKDLLIRMKSSGKTAVISQDEQLTYREWFASSEATASNLARMCGNRGKNIVLCLPNSIEYAIAYFAVLFSGNVIVPVAPSATGTEVESLIRYCESPVVITKRCYVEAFGDLIQSVQVYFMDDWKHTQCAGRLDYETDHNENDMFIMLHTSGTISNPKRVMLSNKNVLDNVRAHTASLGLTESDKSLILLPMFFGYCNTSQFLAHLYLGGTIVIHHGVFRPRAFWKTVVEHRITNVTLVPSMLVNICKAGRFESWDGKTNTLRYICYGGGRSDVGLIERLIGMFPEIGFVHTYGQTECSPRVTALMPADALRKPGSVGLPLPEIKVEIADEDGRMHSSGVRGEICVQGSNVMLGYYKNKELTAETIVDGWLHTGDEGYIDDEGFVYICGRRKCMIICNGINVYPEEIEEVLLSCDMIKDARVYGREDPLCGEIPVADVIVNPGFCAEKLREYCQKRLSAYKIPRKFIIVDHIEKTYNLKNKR